MWGIDLDEVKMKAATRIVLTIFFVGLIPMGVVWGQGLDAIIEEALQRNPEILAAKRRWGAVKAKVPQVRTWPDPHYLEGGGPTNSPSSPQHHSKSALTCPLKDP